MIEIDTFRLQPQSSRHGTPAYSLLLHQDRPVLPPLAGVSLEAQFAIDPDHSLLLVTDDCPYEERLHFYLLNPDHRILDQLHLGYPYTPGILHDIRILSANQLEFSFIGALRYCLTIHSRARFLWNPSIGFGELYRCLSLRRLQLTVR